MSEGVCHCSSDYKMSQQDRHNVDCGKANLGEHFNINLEVVSPQKTMRRPSSVLLNNGNSRKPSPFTDTVDGKDLENTEEDSEAGSQFEDNVKQLDFYYGLVKKQLLRYQSPTTGLYPSQSSDVVVASVRDSVYCCVAVWSLYQAYKRIDDDRGKSYELGQSCVFCMRGILKCWMKQSNKLEAWKENQCPQLALHVLFHLQTGEEVVSSKEYNHFQLDVVSLYLIYLVQMTRSGLGIVYSMSEVAFVQNLVYYIERAYRSPDYGVWGRGTKYNDGNTEAHATSIGMAKAALEAVNGENLFGAKGANYSTIYADIDAHNRNRTIFQTLLPRESNTKSVDAALLATLSFPAFATHGTALYQKTKHKIIKKLKGKYGFKRFLLDGYENVLENPSERHYKKGGTLDFENIENEWPIFFSFMIIEAMFRSDEKQVEEYQKLMSKCLLYDPTSGDPIMPKMYFIPRHNLKAERENPGSQKRKASVSGSMNDLFLWGQAMLVIGELLTSNLLNITELDPIRMHLPSSNRARISGRYSYFHAMTTDLVVQVVMIAESTRLQAMLANYGIQTQTPHEVEPVQIWSPSEMVKVLKYMGTCSQLGLKGRPVRPIGSLGTSKVYRVCRQTVLCYPLVLSKSDFYLSYDMALLTDDIKSELQFISRCWRLAGRPTFCIVISEDNMRDPQFPKMLALLADLKRGNCDGVKIRLGRLQNLIASSCVEHVDIHDLANEDIAKLDVEPVEELACQYAGYQSLTDIPKTLEMIEDKQDYVKLFESRPSNEIVSAMNGLNHMYGHIQLCGLLLRREGPEFWLGDVTVKERLENFNRKAGQLRYWAAVRYTSSLLQKMVDSISPFVTQIVVSGKQVSVGTIGVDSSLFDRSMTPREIHSAIYSKVHPYDVSGAVLQQEMIIYCGKLIATQPDLFNGILVLRMDWLVHTIQLYREFKDMNVGPIENIAPSEIRNLLIEVLENTKDMVKTKSNLSDHQIIQINGCLMRVPPHFYSKVWQILKRCPGGLKFGSSHLPQLPTINNMNMRELAFSHLVEGFFIQYQQPEYRQVIVQLLSILSTILQRNPELSFKPELNIDNLIHNALRLFQKEEDLVVDDTEDMTQFYAMNQATINSYLARSIVNTLLVRVDLTQASDGNCSVQ